MPDSSNATENFDHVRLEDYRTLVEAAKMLPRINGRKIHTSTLWRWCRRGCNGVCLQYVRIGKNIMVSQDALHQFFTALAAVDSAQADCQHRTPIRRKRRPRPAQRQAAQNEAETILRKAKILV